MSVRRYEQGGWMDDGMMIPDPDGDYVMFTDYESLRQRAEDAEAERDTMTDRFNVTMRRVQEAEAERDEACRVLGDLRAKYPDAETLAVLAPDDTTFKGRRYSGDLATQGELERIDAFLAKMEPKP